MATISKELFNKILESAKTQKELAALYKPYQDIGYSLSETQFYDMIKRAQALPKGGE